MLCLGVVCTSPEGWTMLIGTAIAVLFFLILARSGVAWW